MKVTVLQYKNKIKGMAEKNGSSNVNKMTDNNANGIAISDSKAGVNGQTDHTDKATKFPLI